MGTGKRHDRLQVLSVLQYRRSGLKRKKPALATQQSSFVTQALTILPVLQKLQLLPVPFATAVQKRLFARVQLRVTHVTIMIELVIAVATDVKVLHPESMDIDPATCFPFHRTPFSATPFILMPFGLTDSNSTVIKSLSTSTR